jgi:hypothetical protein
MPATAPPAGEMLVIVGDCRYEELGSYRLLLSGFVQLLRNRSPRAARRKKDVVLAKGSIGIPAFWNSRDEKSLILVLVFN